MLHLTYHLSAVLAPQGRRKGDPQVTVGFNWRVPGHQQLQWPEGAL